MMDNSTLTLPIHNQKGRTKAKLPKGRTGCLTCRTRRVKCDELKPNCKRCQIYGVKCAGYQIFVYNNTPEHRHRPKCITVQSKILRIFTGARFENGRHLQMFQSLSRQNATQTSFPSRIRLWQRVIPQTGETEPFVYHMVVAISSLVNSLGFASSFDERAVVKDPQVEHQDALQKYGKALFEMRKAAENGRFNLRTNLIACFLAFTFEMLLGNQKAACALVNTGMNLIQEGSSNKTGHNLEDELVQAYSCLNYEVWLLMGNCSMAVIKRLIKEDDKEIPRMPRIIKTLDEAMHFWQLIKRRNLHVMSIKTFVEKTPATFDELGDPDAGTQASPKAPCSEVGAPSLLEAECMKSLKYIHHWLCATKDVFNTLTDSSSILAKLLVIQAHMYIINVSGKSCTTEMIYDTLTPHFRAIVDLSTSVYEYRESSSLIFRIYPFDFGIIAGLFTVGTRCRDHDIRTQVIGLLSASHYREGFWDSLPVAEMVKWLRFVEEKGVGKGELIPEEKRAILTSADMDLFRRRGTVTCLQRGGVDGTIRSEKIITW